MVMWAAVRVVSSSRIRLSSCWGTIKTVSNVATHSSARTLNCVNVWVHMIFQGCHSLRLFSPVFNYGPATHDIPVSALLWAKQIRLNSQEGFDPTSLYPYFYYQKNGTAPPQTHFWSTFGIVSAPVTDHTNTSSLIVHMRGVNSVFPHSGGGQRSVSVSQLYGRRENKKHIAQSLLAELSPVKQIRAKCARVRDGLSVCLLVIFSVVAALLALARIFLLRGLLTVTPSCLNYKTGRIMGGDPS